MLVFPLKFLFVFLDHLPLKKIYIFLGIKIFKFGQKVNFLVFVFVKYLFTEFGVNNWLNKMASKYGAVTHVV